MVDILSGIPSIVAALFIYALLITILGFGRSAFAVSLALVLLMLPTVLRSTEEMLKLVPDSLREASYALGVPKWKTILQGRHPDRVQRHLHRRRARPGPGDGRDRAAADPGRPTRSGINFSPDLRHHGRAADHDQLRPGPGADACPATSGSGPPP